MYQVQPGASNAPVTSTTTSAAPAPTPASTTSTTVPSSSNKRKAEVLEDSTKATNPPSSSVTPTEFKDSMAVIVALDSLLGAILASRVVSPPTAEDSMLRTVLEWLFTSDEGKIVEKMTDLKVILAKYISKTNPQVQRTTDSLRLLATLVALSRGDSDDSSFSINGNVEIPVAAAPPPPPPPAPPAPPAPTSSTQQRPAKINANGLSKLEATTPWSPHWTRWRPPHGPEVNWTLWRKGRV